MRLVISGATGFIGAGMTRHLEDSGANVLPVISRRAGGRGTGSKEARIDEILPSDSIEVMAAKMRKFGASKLLHAATHFTPESEPQNVRDVVSANLQFSINALEGAVLAGIKEFVILNSFWQIPWLAPSRNARTSPYTASKSAFQTYVTCRLNKSHRLTQVYIVDTFGPGDARRKLVNYLITANLSGQEVTLKTPDTPLLLAYSDNLTAFLSTVLEHPSEVPEEILYVNYLGQTPQTLNKNISQIISQGSIRDYASTESGIRLEDRMHVAGLDAPIGLETALRESIQSATISLG